MKKKRLHNYKLWLVPFFTVTALFLVVPLFLMVTSSFTNGTTGAFTLSNYAEVFTNAFYYQSFLNSGVIALFSSIVGLSFAIIVAYAMTCLPEKIQDKISNLGSLQEFEKWTKLDVLPYCYHGFIKMKSTFIWF